MTTLKEIPILNMQKPLIYLASPYSHPDPQMRHHRFVQVCRAAARLMQAGHIVFSPIAHSHSIAEYEELPGNWEFWQEFCLATLGRCDQLWILCLDGWEVSTGVNAEIQIARDRNIFIQHINPNSLHLCDD